MSLLFDLSSAQPQGDMVINGGGEYAYLLFCELLKNISPNEVTVLLASFNGENSNVINLCKKNNIKIIYYDIVENITGIIAEGKYNKVVFPVCYCKYGSVKISNSVQVYTVIHDLCDLYYYGANVKIGEFISKYKYINTLRKIKKGLVRKKRMEEIIQSHNKILNLSLNQHIYTVSYYTKSAMIKYLDCGDKNINVYYTPERIMHKNISIDRDSIFEKYGIKPKKFFMLMAGCRWTKNNAIVLKTLDNMFGNPRYNMFLDNFKVVLLGVDSRNLDFYHRELTQIDRFIFDGYVDDVTLDVLYKEAYLFVFPSILEGFGLPPIEAMKRKTLCACTTAMSIPEVCGDAAIYFDPYDSNSIEQAIIRSFDKKLKVILESNMEKRLLSLAKKREDDLKEIILDIVSK